MGREDIIARLRQNEAALRSRGVIHAALFGSRWRGKAHLGSDTDIMIEINPGGRIGVYEYVGLKVYIASLFDGPVDVVNRDGLKPYVRPAAAADAIYAFRGQTFGGRPRQRLCVVGLGPEARRVAHLRRFVSIGCCKPGSLRCIL